MPMVSKYNFWEQKVSIYIEHFKHEGFIKKKHHKSEKLNFRLQKIKYKHHFCLALYKTGQTGVKQYAVRF